VNADAAPPTPQIRNAPEPPLEGRISANTLYQLEKCERRLWLHRHAPGEAAPPGDFDRLLWARGEEHERRVRESFVGLVGPLWRSGQPLAPAAEETRRLLRESRAPLYQPALLSRDGRRAGVPDFLYHDRGGVVIREAKLAVHLETHPEIALQMTHYARLLEDWAGIPPARLEITNGRGDVLEVPPLGAGAYEERLERAAALLGEGPEPDLLLAHSTCVECPFYDHCWRRAAAERRVEILSGVWTNHVPVLRGMGIRTVEDLAAREPHSMAIPGLGRLGVAMVHEARAHRDRAPVWLAPPRLPLERARVWFDLEGDPETQEVEGTIYLWGLAVDEGAARPRAEAILATPEQGGDRGAWERFVARALEIFRQFPDAVWVHYASYERTWVRKYVERHGAPGGFRERMEGALFDLYSRLLASLRLPLLSYSIKHVAPYTGFAWSILESGSDWSIVQYHRARETRDPVRRAALLDEIARYNADDLWAMKSVWEWMERNGPRG